jgi:hypothetical protein
MTAITPLPSRAPSVLFICGNHEWSTLAYVGLALGKPTYSYRDLAHHRTMLPEQHGRAAANIAGVCREVMFARGARRAEPAA